MDRARRTLAIAAAVIAFVVALVAWRDRCPAPLGKDAPADRFSAERARDIQRAIAFQPRPTGSLANARARAILVKALTEAGFDVSEQRAFACGRYGACAYVVNVIALRPGADAAGPVVMLVAHHDSVPSSPGGSDDGMGASALAEVARALGTQPAPKHTIAILLTDAEEDGLVGAEAFAREHPLAKRVRAVVNVDARGSSGPSSMFQTGRDNAWIVDLYARAAERPSSSSLFFEVYKRMPNDTDFTVLGQAAAGLSIANVETIARYHTPLDTFEGASAATLQHHGDQTLALARALASHDLDATPHGDASWFDVLGAFVVRWPLGLTLPLALVAFALVALQAFRLRGLRFGRALVVGPGALLFGLAGALVVGYAVESKLVAPWIAHPLPFVASLHLATIALASFAGMLFARTPEQQRIAWASTWLLWAFAGVAVASVAPGAAWLFLVPAAVAGLAPFAGRTEALAFDLAVAAPAAVAALLWAPLAMPTYEALGFFLPAALALPSAMIMTTIAPVLACAPGRAALVPAALAIALAVLGLSRPTFSADHPQRLDVLTVQTDGEPNARVVAQASWGPRPWGPLPTAVREALGPATSTEAIPPFLVPSLVAPTSRLDLPAPVIEGGRHDADSRERIVRLRSRRGAPTLLLDTRMAGTRVRVNGVTATFRGTFVVFRAVPPEGIEVTIDPGAKRGEPMDLALYDLTPGAAGELASKVVAARTRLGTAVPTQDGDATVLATRARL